MHAEKLPLFHRHLPSAYCAIFPGLRKGYFLLRLYFSQFYCCLLKPFSRCLLELFTDITVGSCETLFSFYFTGRSLFKASAISDGIDFTLAMVRSGS